MKDFLFLYVAVWDVPFWGGSKKAAPDRALVQTLFREDCLETGGILQEEWSLD